jgi:hypothetical protein
MPEYLAPGVYVEEVSFRAKSIEGVGTTTTGFVGPTRYGPLDLEPELITSLVEFERTYGGRERLEFASGEVKTTIDNYMWHAARAFFEEGGKRLYVSRVFTAAAAATSDAAGSDAAGSDAANPKLADAHAGCARAQTTDLPTGLTVRARFPGRAGNARATFTFNAGQNVLVDEDPTSDKGVPGVRSLRHLDVVLLRSTKKLPSPEAPDFFLAEHNATTGAWTFTQGGGGAEKRLGDLDARATEVRVVTVTVSVDPFAEGAASYTERDLPLDPRHRSGDSPDSLFDAFAPHARASGSPNARILANLARARTVPIVAEGDFANGVAVLKAFFDAGQASDSPPPAGSSPLRTALVTPSATLEQRSLPLLLTDGHDGARPEGDAYNGRTDPATDLKTGLAQFEDLEDIAIVAAPGSTFGYETEHYGPKARTIVRHLINHAQRMRYRIAVVDSGDAQSISQVRAMRAQLDSSHAALYYPWVRVLDPLTRREIHLPPSGFVAGIYARNDVNRAVYKAPANEVVNLALGFERSLNKAQQEVLNPEGINCFRYFEGRGMRLWGARTSASDPEWKYVNVRRYFAYLERSIDKGTQWAVFEPNGEQLWANVRSTIADFLLDEWQNGALLGDKPDKAYFVRCDRSTMSQNDLDNGRLICLVGVAPLRPAEFVILRVGQWTADRKV